MILTPTITVNNDHLASFNKEIKEFNRSNGSHSKYYGNGHLDGTVIEMKHIRAAQGNGILIMCTSNNGDVLATARLLSAPIPQGALPWSRKVYVVDRIRVHNDYIGNGIAPALYVWLADRGYTLISDSHQTPVSLAVWRKLASKEKVFTINIEDGMWRPYDPMRVEDWMLFGNNDQMRYWPIRFVLPSR
jgi:hypothetical protein